MAGAQHPGEGRLDRLTHAALRGSEQLQQPEFVDGDRGPARWGQSQTAPAIERHEHENGADRHRGLLAVGTTADPYEVPLDAPARLMRERPAAERPDEQLLGIG